MHFVVRIETLLRDNIRAVLKEVIVGVFSPDVNNRKQFSNVLFIWIPSEIIDTRNANEAFFLMREAKVSIPLYQNVKFSLFVPWFWNKMFFFFQHKEKKT